MKRMGCESATPTAIEAIYRHRFRAFVVSATALLGDGEAALDLVQDGFAIALRRHGSFRGEGDLEAWLWRIVLNLGRDRLRATRFKPTLVSSEVGLEALAPHDDLRKSLLALPERQRLAIFLRYYADLSYGQIADALGISRGTVAASLNAAHAALRHRLQEVAQ